jgi:TonB-linked SusC/RagA family outer membrane protein
MARTLSWLCTRVAPLALLPGILLAQQPAIVTGRVADETGKPLALATVAIPALGVGATTRQNGEYTILVPAARATGQQTALTARIIGYKPQSVLITLREGTVSQDFALASNPLQLGEIVVTGAGTETTVEKYANVRNSVSEELIKKSNESNVVQALAGKAPNVQVSQNSGEPGAGSFISIRGIRTVNGRLQPLMVVDGTPVDNSTFTTGRFNAPDAGGGALAVGAFGESQGTGNANRGVDLNPDDVESVEILKGAAAAAIYGSRAAQGVILIKTKAGHAGPTRWTFGTTLSADRVAKKYPLQTRWGEGTLGVDPRVADPTACNFPAASCRRTWGPDLTDPATAALGVPTTVYDHASEAYNTGYVSTSNASVSGGDDRTTFYVSGEFLHNNGVFKTDHDKFERGTVRVNASHRLSDAFKVGANLQYANTSGQYIQRGNNTNGLQLGLLRTPPNFNNQPYLVNGFHRGYLFQNPTVPGAGGAGGFDNPFFVLNEDHNTTQVNRVFGNLNLEWLANSWLKFNYTLGGDYAQDERLEGAPVQASDVSAGGRVVEGKITQTSLDHSLNATVNWQVNPNLSGTFTAGQGLTVRNFREIGTTGRFLIKDGLFRLSNTVSRDPIIDDQNNIHNVSYFGQATLDVYQQLFLTLAATNYGSSTFSANHRRRWYPKLGAAWEFTKPLGLSGGSFLSYGKLRAAYGEAGTEAPPYVTSNVFSGALFAGVVQGVALTPTLQNNGGLSTASIFPSTDIGPELSKEFELGTDLGFWGDKADLSLTYYNSRTEDVILNLPLAPSSGFLTQYQNAMKLRNRGVEVALNFRPVQSTDFGWDVGVQWAKNKSRTLEIRGPTFVDADPSGFVQTVAIAGEEYGVFRGTGYARCGVSPGGLGATIEGVDLDTFCSATDKANHALYIDVDGLPAVDNTQRVLANPNPKWTGNVHTSLRFRKFTISGLLDVKHGGQVWNGTQGALLSYGTSKFTEERCVFDALGNCTGNDKAIGVDPVYGFPTQPIVGPGAGTKIPIGEDWYRNSNTPCPFSGVDEVCYEDGGYVKLREVSVAFSLDAPWVQRALGLGSIDLRVAGRNLHTWSDYSGYDPEANIGGAISSRSIDYFNHPQTRSYVFSVTLNR